MARAGNLRSPLLRNDRRPLLFALLLAAAPLSPQEAPDLLTLELPVRVNGLIKGLVTARIDQRTETLYDLDEGVLAMIEDYDAVRAPLPPGPDPQGGGGIHPERLAALGITARFDAYHVEVSITVDPAVRKVRRHSLGGAAGAAEASLREEEVGGGLNLSTSLALDLSTPAGGGPTEAWTSFGLKYGAFLTLRGWVLETDGALSLDGAASRFAFGGAVLTHDFRERLLRLQAGTVAYPVLANQIRLPVYGAALYTDPSFDPAYRANSYDASFFLAKSSEVEILRNGMRVWSDTLPAGPHLVTDIPIDNGANRVEILVDGNPSVVEIPFESSLIRSGEWRWGAVAGITKAEPFLPVAAGYGRHGFSPSVTGGAFLHADLNTQALGSDFVFALPVGGLDAALAANHSWTADVGHRWGAMGHVGYRIQDIGGSGLNLSASMAGRSPWSFAAGAPGASNLYAFSARLALSGPLPRTPIRLDGGASMDAGFLPQDTKQLIWAGLNSRLGKTGNLSFAMTWNPLPEVVSDRFRADLSLSFSFDGPLSEFGFRQSASEPRTSLSARGGLPLGKGKFSWETQAESPIFLSAASTTEVFALGGQAQWEGDRLEARLSHDFGYDQGGASGDLWTNRTQAQLDTGLAFAGTSLAWTAPTDRNLIVIRGTGAFKGIPVGIPSGGGWAALTDAFGPVADSGFPSYRLRRLEVAPLEIPDGLDPGNASHAIFPGYRSAYSVSIGGSPAIKLGGRILDAEGAPLEFVSGRISPVPADPPAAEGSVPPEADEGSDGAEIRFFTVEGGRFEADGLSPGPWILTMAGDRGGARVLIPENTERTHEAGDILLAGGTP